MGGLKNKFYPNTWVNNGKSVFYVTGFAKINHVSTKIADFFIFALTY